MTLPQDRVYSRQLKQLRVANPTLGASRVPCNPNPVRAGSFNGLVDSATGTCTIAGGYLYFGSHFFPPGPTYEPDGVRRVLWHKASGMDISTTQLFTWDTANLGITHYFASDGTNAYGGLYDALTGTGPQYIWRITQDGTWSLFCPIPGTDRHNYTIDLQPFTATMSYFYVFRTSYLVTSVWQPGRFFRVGTDASVTDIGMPSAFLYNNSTTDPAACCATADGAIWFLGKSSGVTRRIGVWRWVPGVDNGRWFDLGLTANQVQGTNLLLYPVCDNSVIAYGTATIGYGR